jgi:hypothetical protein
MAGILFLNIFKIESAMNRIQFLMIVLAFLAVSFPAMAQINSSYIFFKPVYAFPTASEQLNVNTTTVNGETFSKGIYGSYANGIAFDLGFGKMINSTLGYEIGAEYLLGKKITAVYTSETTDKYSNKVDAITLRPVLVIRSGGDLLAIYSKLGLAILIWSRSFEDNQFHTVDAYGTNHLNITSATENIKPKVGFTAAFGITFRVSEAVSLFTEVNGQLMSLPIYKGHFTSYEDNGVNTLPNLSVNKSQWVYVKSGNFDNQPDTEPEQRLYKPPNYSYIGISVGMNYHF